MIDYPALPILNISKLQPGYFAVVSPEGKHTYNYLMSQPVATYECHACYCPISDKGGLRPQDAQTNPRSRLCSRVCWYGSEAATTTPPKNPVGLCAHSCAAAQSALHDYLWLRRIHLPSTEIAHGAVLHPLVSLTAPGSVTF